MEARSRRRLLLGIGLCGLVGLGAAALSGTFGALTPAQIAAERATARARAAAQAAARLLAKEQDAVARAQLLVAAPTPKRVGSLAPGAPPNLFTTPASAHQVIGYVPYWTMTSLTTADFTDVSALAYYGVGISPDGSLVRSGPGWSDATGSAFTGFVAHAHAAGDRVLLTLSNQTSPQIAALLKAPAATSARLAADVIPLLAQDGLDGVSIDIEGRSPGERGRFVTFVTDLAARLRSADPNGEIVLDTYPQSAGDPTDFFDVAALARQVDLLFIMAYDMQNPTIASAGAPLANPSLGLSDVQALISYEKVVPPSKLVLGSPFYGYDYTTLDATPGSPTIGTTPVAVTYASIVEAGRKAYWDPGSLTPYTRLRRGQSYHQTWYEDPVSIALKTALADEYHLAGTGAWALGDEGNATSMLVALGGGTRPTKLALLAGPTQSAVAAAIASGSAG